MGDHRAQEAKGRMKEAAGSLAGEGDLVRKGKDDRSKARVKKTAGDMKTKAGRAAGKTRDKVSEAVGRATGRRRS